MSTKDGGHRDAAIVALATRDYVLAGDEYTRAAWRCLSEPRAGLSPFEEDDTGWVGRALQSFATAAIAYRVAGHPGRATHRGVEGIAVARDLQRSVAHPVQAACLAEFIADFRVVGGMDGATDAYADAETEYEAVAAEVDDTQYWATTPLFEAAIAPIKQVARGLNNGEIAIAWEDVHGSDPAAPGRFLAHRAQYKRQRFPALVEQVVDDGSLAAPRGTTEYDNANHHCPNCGSTDVNWSGGDVLCLRCSTRMDER